VACSLRPIAQGRPWLILDERGGDIGRVLLPTAVQRIAEAERNRIWVIERNADNVPSVVRYRIEPGG
jgi:hypothetical protein